MDTYLIYFYFWSLNTSSTNDGVALTKGRGGTKSAEDNVRRSHYNKCDLLY
ncbi:hypothetical protein GHT06_017406 [Daphnia sinensis]|uniref:Uncharacterized protein n=1 Tax=Daphnia sinensis TaxID=1820382 RepID=A0AAD5PTT6_9CRUS|nr:hypothetical protein GHT06_017406 [Daphnia sinensis]